jgi:hypothetical protein
VHAIPAMQEASAAWPWFQPSVVVIAQRSLQGAGWGVTFRVIFCAMLTYTDMGSDLYTYFQYRSIGQEFFADATLTILGISMLFQLVLVITQDNCSPPAMLKGVLLVVSGLKPASDAWRVVKGVVMEAHQMMPPISENAISKVLEVAFESTPAAFFQAWAMVLGLSTLLQDPPTAIQYVSLLSSVLTAAFIVTSADCKSWPTLTTCPVLAVI